MGLSGSTLVSLSVRSCLLLSLLFACVVPAENTTEGQSLLQIAYSRIFKSFEEWREAAMLTWSLVP